MVRTEIFLQSSRPAAFMVDGAVHWFTNFIVGFTFPSVQVSGAVRCEAGAGRPLPHSLLHSAHPRGGRGSGK